VAIGNQRKGLGDTDPIGLVPFGPVAYQPSVGTS